MTFDIPRPSLLSRTRARALFLMTALLMPGMRPGQDALHAGQIRSGLPPAGPMGPRAKHSVDPRGRVAALWNGDGGFRLYDLATGQLLDEFHGKAVPEPGKSIRWAPSGLRFSFRGKIPRELMVYEVATREVRTIRKNRVSRIIRSAWSPDGTRLALVESSANPLGQARTVRILDADPESPVHGDEIAELRIDDEWLPGSITYLWWPDPRNIVVWSSDTGSHLRESYKQNGQVYFREVVLDVSSGAVRGHGLARDLGAFEHEPWVYTSNETGKSGDFLELFGFPHPDRHPERGGMGGLDPNPPHDQELVRRLFKEWLRL